MNRNLSCLSWIVAGVLCVACGARDSLYDGRSASTVGGESSAASGTSSTGGMTFVASGGAFVVTTGGHSYATGGAISSGGAILTGGATSRPAGGANATGGASVKATGGAISTGGTLTTGGAIATGGTLATGGVLGSGGAIATGGTTALANGGATATGGATPLPTGGANPTGGTTALATGGASTGGSTTIGQSCILRVSTTGKDGNDGTTWASAFANVQPAISAGTNLVSAGACSSVEVWVAAGTYKPTFLTDSSDPRTATFQLAANVALYGGFVGTESTRSARDFNANVTTLSGDIGAANDTSDNIYHVVTGATGATIDGFTITAGNASSGIGSDGMGGGMRNWSVSPTVANCIFKRNSASAGAGMSNYPNSSPTVTNCEFLANSATGIGGGMYNYPSAATIVNCTFIGNSARAGGGMYNGASSATITHCTFSDNVASNEGGGMVNDHSSPRVSNTSFFRNSCTSAYYGASEGGGAVANNNSSVPVFTNCTFAGNSSGSGGYGYGGAMLNSVSSSPTVLNCIFWGDSAPSSGAEIYNFYNYDPSTASTPIVSHSIIAGGYPGTGNLNIDPLLNTDLTVQAGSPAIDSGACGATVTTTDIIGNPRWDIASVPNASGSSSVDIGAYEYQGVAGTDSTLKNVACP